MVMEKMMQRLTMDKATQYSGKSFEKLKKRRQDLVHVRIIYKHVHLYIVQV